MGNLVLARFWTITTRDDSDVHHGHRSNSGPNCEELDYPTISNTLLPNAAKAVAKVRIRLTGAVALHVPLAWLHRVITLV